MVMMYRIIHHVIAIPSQMYLTSATTRITRSHAQKCSIPFSRISSHLYSYYPSAIRTWNSLPAVLISFPTLGAFKWRWLMYMCRHSYHKFYCKYYIFDMCFLSHASVSANVHSTSSIILRTTEGWTVLEEEECCENVRIQSVSSSEAYDLWNINSIRGSCWYITINVWNI